jgi:hypothetical protein
MAQTEPMSWPLQCVVTEAWGKVLDVGEGGIEGDKGGDAVVRSKGYGLGEKGMFPSSLSIPFSRS